MRIPRAVRVLRFHGLSRDIHSKFPGPIFIHDISKHLQACLLPLLDVEHITLTPSIFMEFVTMADHFPLLSRLASLQLYSVRDSYRLIRAGLRQFHSSFRLYANFEVNIIDAESVPRVDGSTVTTSLRSLYFGRSWIQDPLTVATWLGDLCPAESISVRKPFRVYDTVSHMWIEVKATVDRLQRERRKLLRG
jgi:hypothetical protein